MKALARDCEGTLTGISDEIGLAGALQFLASALPQPEAFADLVAAAKLPDAEKWHSRLFPSAPVYLYLPLPMLDRLPVLWRFAASQVPGAPAEAPEFLALPRGEVRLDRGRGAALVGSRVLPLSLAVQIQPKGVQVTPLGQTGHMLVVVAGLLHLYLLRSDYAHTLLFRLLFTAPLTTPHFQTWLSP